MSTIQKYNPNLVLAGDSIGNKSYVLRNEKVIDEVTQPPFDFAILKYSTTTSRWVLDNDPNEQFGSGPFYTSYVVTKTGVDDQDSATGDTVTTVDLSTALTSTNHANRWHLEIKVMLHTEDCYAYAEFNVEKISNTTALNVSTYIVNEKYQDLKDVLYNPPTLNMPTLDISNLGSLGNIYIKRTGGNVLNASVVYYCVEAKLYPQAPYSLQISDKPFIF